MTQATSPLRVESIWFDRTPDAAAPTWTFLDPSAIGSWSAVTILGNRSAMTIRRLDGAAVPLFAVANRQIGSLSLSRMANEAIPAMLFPADQIALAGLGFGVPDGHLWWRRVDCLDLSLRLPTI